MKANETNGVDTTSFLKKFRGTNVFVHIWLFESILIKKKASVAVNKLIEQRKFCCEKFIFYCLRHFSRSIFFLKLLFLPVFVL